MNKIYQIYNAFYEEEKTFYTTEEYCQYIQDVMPRMFNDSKKDPDCDFFDNVEEMRSLLYIKVSESGTLAELVATHPNAEITIDRAKFGQLQSRWYSKKIQSDWYYRRGVIANNMEQLEDYLRH